MTSRQITVHDICYYLNCFPEETNVILIVPRVNHIWTFYSYMKGCATGKLLACGGVDNIEISAGTAKTAQQLNLYLNVVIGITQR